MTIKILAILNLVIASQAFFLCIHFILKSKGVLVLNRLIAFLCFTFAIISLNTYLNISGIYLLQDISNNLLWFIGPCLRQYVIYDKKNIENRLIYLNTFPFVALVLIDFLFDWQWFKDIIPFVGFVQMITYTFLSMKYCIDNYTKAKQYYNWILPSVIVFAILIIINFSLSILDRMGINIISNIVLQCFTSLLVVPIFYLAYREMNHTKDFGISPRKYLTSQISEEKTKEYLTAIEVAMRDDKMYLQKNLTLKTFSQHVSINQKYVSQIINHNLQMSFSDYVLKFRLDDVKKSLSNSKNQNLTIFGIAQECGFKSNSRFNFLFKLHTGLTPKEFQKLYSK